MADEMTGQDGDLRSRVVSLEHKGASQETRLANIETWRTERDIERARHDEKWTNMERRFDHIEKKIGSINDSMTWITRLIIGAIVLAGITFMMSGGIKPL
jgi:hypothetical protein